MKNYNKQLIRRKFIDSAVGKGLPKFGWGGFTNFIDKTLNLDMGFYDAIRDQKAKETQRRKTLHDQNLLKQQLKDQEAFKLQKQERERAEAEAESQRQRAAAAMEAERVANTANYNEIQQGLLKPVNIDTANYNELSQMTYRKGGLHKPTKYKNGGEVANAELERAEPYMTPDGFISHVKEDAPTHEDGGVPVSLPANTKIIGKDVNGSEELKKAGIRLAKLQKKFNKVLENKPSNVDRRTAEMNIKNATIEFNNLFMQQELQKVTNQLIAQNKGGLNNG
jgi:multidrug efflux pump subunit AcrA (membrane-fusion protein)